MSSYYSSFKSNISKARNLGASHHGSSHWIMQRLSSILLVFLFIWFAYFLISVSGLTYLGVISQIKHPSNFIPFILLVLTSFYHSSLGMQVVIEDYISCLMLRYFMIITLKFFVFITVFTVLFSSIYFLING